VFAVLALLIRLTKVCLGVLAALLHSERRELYLGFLHLAFLYPPVLDKEAFPVISPVVA
jgi:hypothetical protein